MTDIRRTVLWMVFALSLVMLWDAWNIQHGQSSLFNFGGRQNTSASPASAPTVVGAVAPVTNTSNGASQLVADAPSEKVVIMTDLYKATIDTRGGDLIK